MGGLDESCKFPEVLFIDLLLIDSVLDSERDPVAGCRFQSLLVLSNRSCVLPKRINKCVFDQLLSNGVHGVLSRRAAWVLVLRDDCTEV